MEKTSDPARESPWSQSVDLLLEATMQSNNEHILKRLEHFRTKYEQMLLELESSMRKMDRSLDYTNNLLRLDLMNQYKEKSDLAKENMARVSNRILTIQHRLNNMRKAIPSKKLSLVERGPFRYRCLVSEGVRHREYPSIRARNIPLQAVGSGTGGTTSDGTVLFNEIVEISERYVIESTVFKAITGRMQKRVHGRELALVQELLTLILSFLQELQQKVVV